MAKQLNQVNVNLAFNADTSKAKAQIRDLQAELTKLSTASIVGTFNNADMEKAISAAKSLQMHLNNAVNVDTGKLDLSRFSKSLNSSNQTLESLRNDLSLAGEQGNQAFLQLARSISQAEAPAIRISNTFREMGNTLKNTIRWQLSSSILHGFMGAIQSAYGYTQDLDESLNNIRIVTGQSKEEMAEFAENANKAAKALSTTTTAYTNAALIYYQQGDDDKTVLEKTDVTAKMANVTGTSAEEVSNQLTAIWNNFNKSGEESYEKYADILTALGAATASSTDEIAGGLEKFASIADMIGLSYEYAASALATITATTRQSEDVVGTALKTIFARIQGLNLGETLDDGTTLNKYSEALMKVGISIRDQNGELKDMDNILNEMGAKWQTLSKDQQVSLAQTVAGVRQYNQLVSLMDNWDYFGENLAIAQGSEGTLNAQAAIYAESWEAASKRVQAATEDVFDSLIDDDFFITLTNGTAEFVDGIGQVIDALGGMKGIITLVSSIFLTNFSKEIPSTIQKLTENFNVLTGKAQKDAISMIEQNQKALEGFTSDNMTNALDAELTSLTKVNEMKTSLAKTSHLLTEAERQQFEQEIQMVEAAGQLVAKEGEKVDAIEKEIAANERRLIAESVRNKQSLDGSGPRISNLNGDKEQANKIRAKLTELKKLTQEYVACEQVIKRLNMANATWLTSGEVSAKSMIKNMTVFKQSFIEARGGVDKLTDAEKQMCNTLEAEIEAANGDVNKLKKAFENFGNSIKSSLNPVVFDLMDKEIADIEQALRNLGVDNDALNDLEQQFREGALTTDEYRQKLLALANTESQSVVHAVKMSETIGFIGAKMMQVSMAANTLKQAWNIWNDEDATLMEKILTTMTAFGTVIPLITAVTNADNAVQTASHAINLANLGLKLKLPFAEKLHAAATAALTAAKAAETGAVEANTVAWYANPIMWIALIVMGVVAALVVLISTIKKLTELLIKGNKIETENCDTLIENAEKTKELAAANEELSSSIEDLISEYKNLNAEGENTSEILQKIQDAMPELIKSYREFTDIVNIPGLNESIDELERLGNLGNLIGDYSGFEEKKAEIDKTVAIETARSAKSGATASNTVLAAKMQETQGKVSGKQFTVNVGGLNTSGEEEKAKTILQSNMGDYFKSSNSLFKSGAKLTLDDYTDPTKLVDYYEGLVKARDEMLKTMSQAELADSDIFREINELIATTSSEYQTAKEQANEYLSVAGKAVEASMGNTADIDTMEEYLQYKKEFIKVAQKEYDLTLEQAESYLKQVDSLSKLTNQYELATIMAEKFSGIDITNPEFKKAANEYYKFMSDAFGDLSDQELEIAVAVAATSESLEDFTQQLQLRMIEAAQVGAAESAEIASETMADSLEEGKINFASLFANDNFLEYLQQNQISQKALLTKSYEEQYRIVSDFYGKMNALSFESFTAQQELYYQQAASVQTQAANYQKAMSENADAVNKAKEKYADFQAQLAKTTDETQIDAIKEDMEDLAEQFEKDYGFEITSNAETFQNELDQILETIEQIQDKKIEVAMDWSGVDELEAGLKKASEFTKLVKNDTKKVGDTYQMTAAQAREWLEFYPELGEIAEVTTDGLIAMDAEKVDAFLDEKETELDGSVRVEIEKLKVQREGLESELKIREADLKSAKALAQGKLDLENASAQYLTELRTNLTQYFIDLGLDETTANAAALDTMGLNEEEYAKLVADKCETNALNMQQSAEDGANAQVASLGQLVERWQNFASFLVNNIGKVLKDIGAAILDPTRTVGDVMRGYWNASAITIDEVGNSNYSSVDGAYTFNSGDKAQIDAALKGVSAPQLDSANAAISELEQAINSISGKITYLEALGAQDLEFLGNTDPDDVDGKGNNNKKKDIQDLTKVLERYHEINEEIKTQQRLIDRLSIAKDRAYGKDKIALMEQEIEATQIMLDKQKQLYDAQTAFLAIDKAKVLEKFKDAEFDSYGNVSNYTSLLQNAANTLNEAKRKFNASQSDADKENLETAQKEYDKQLDLLKQYEETLSAWHDQADVLTKLRNQIQDLNYEKLQESLNLKLEIDDSELKKLDYFLNKYSDNFYKMAESAALMNDKIDPTIQKLEDYKSHKEALDKAYENGKISQEAYIEGLKEVREGYYDNLEALIELDKAMMHYYGDTLDAASEELSSFTDHMEHLTSVFDHYMNLMEILGKQKDYDAMGNFLSGKADTIRDRLDVAKEYYEMLKEGSKVDEYWANYQAALAEGDDDMAAWWKEQWDAEVDALDAAQEEMLGLTEEWAEAMKSVIENNMEKIADTLEKTLAGGTTFDTLMDGFDKLNTRQEEYLTKTNQIYETNKLMRTASKALDETDNKVAKQKLKNFIDETKGLQETTQLSKYELEIQQAKYDLLLAQIALEEAQNAKSTVRLSRDSEGNFGYVYTADQNKIDDAQQAVDDADNKLYNLSLEGQQQYTEKYLQAKQNMYEEFKQLEQDYLNDNIASEEEYELRKSQIQEHYLGPEGVLTTYSKLYNIAVQTDANATADYWGQEYGKMTQDTEAWKTAVNDYLLEIDKQIEEWKNIQTTANDEVGGALDNSKKATEDLTTESGNLRDTINDEVIPAISNQIDKVREQTDAYIDQRKKLSDLITEYEKYLSLLDRQVADESLDFSLEAAKAFTSGNLKGVSHYLNLREDKAVVGVNTSISNDRLTNLFDAASGDSSYTKKQQEDASNLITKVAKGDGNFTDKTLSAIGFKTGGYTGDWGPEGKLAILHQKELILNSEDTENMLGIIMAVREIMNSIEKQATWASSGLGMLTPTTYNSTSQNLEQTVTIHAEFPNATNHNEIEEAFNTLINRASQYANRK